jgi:hypothetical protein
MMRYCVCAIPVVQCTMVMVVQCIMGDARMTHKFLYFLPSHTSISLRTHLLKYQPIIQITSLCPPPIKEIIRPWPPRSSNGTFRHATQPIPYVGAAQRTCQHLALADVLLANFRRSAGVSVLVHMLDDADEQAHRNVAAERPAVIPVADDIAEVGDRGKHGKTP